MTVEKDNMAILDIDLDFRLENKKYYVTLMNKILKTKQGYDLFCDDILTLKKVHDDYREFKFKSKWLNLASGYVDFINSQENIKMAKDQFTSYLKNDLLLYLEDESNEYFNFQKNTYIPLLDKFSKKFSIKQRFIPTTGLDKVFIDEESIKKLNEVVETLTLKELFIASFIIKISTSTILSLFYLKEEITLEEFFEIIFNSEIDKLKKTYDKYEEQRLEVIKQELKIMEQFLRP